MYTKRTDINRFDNLDEAYLVILKHVLENYEYSHEIDTQKYDPNDPRNCNKRSRLELTDVTFTINNPSLKMIETKSEKRNRVMTDYFEKELKMCETGDCFGMTKLSKIWDIIKNPDGSINANYGYMTKFIRDAGNSEFISEDQKMTQWEWAKLQLREKQNTCKAYLHFNRPKDQWVDNLDQPCTVFTQFMIRDNKLNFSAYMRSNDIVYGTPYNIMYFFRMMFQMRDELLDIYPNLEIGSYTHNANSLHLYKNHISTAKDMLGIS